jgi:biopolymer transport protein ExbD
MALKRKTKIDASFSTSTMSDIVFLLLIFFLVTSTMISPNALKLILPKSSNQVKAEKAITSVSLRHGDPNYYLDGNASYPLQRQALEQALREKFADIKEPTISLHAEKTCTLDEVVKMMNIAKDNKWKLILATSPEDNR